MSALSMTCEKEPLSTAGLGLVGRNCYVVQIERAGAVRVGDESEPIQSPESRMAAGESIKGLRGLAGQRNRQGKHPVGGLPQRARYFEEKPLAMRDCGEGFAARLEIALSVNPQTRSNTIRVAVITPFMKHDGAGFDAQRKPALDGSRNNRRRIVDMRVEPMREAGRISTLQTLDYAKKQDFGARDELKKKGELISFETVLADVQKRDDQDTNRAHAPLAKAADAHLVDSTAMSLEETVQAIAALVRARTRS